jgi:hypothetical protein
MLSRRQLQGFVGSRLSGTTQRDSLRSQKPCWPASHSVAAQYGSLSDRPALSFFLRQSFSENCVAGKTHAKVGYEP